MLECFFAKMIKKSKTQKKDSLVLPEESKYAFLFKTEAHHYGAGAFAVRCFDNRFWKVFKRFIKFKKLDHIDLSSLAGGAKAFSAPELSSDSSGAENALAPPAKEDKSFSA